MEVRILSQAIFGHKTMTTAIFETWDFFTSLFKAYLLLPVGGANPRNISRSLTRGDKQEFNILENPPGDEFSLAHRLDEVCSLCSLLPCPCQISKTQELTYFILFAQSILTYKCNNNFIIWSSCSVLWYMLYTSIAWTQEPQSLCWLPDSFTVTIRSWIPLLLFILLSRGGYRTAKQPCC